MELASASNKPGVVAALSCISLAEAYNISRPFVSEKKQECVTQSNTSRAPKKSVEDAAQSTKVHFQPIQ